MNRSSFAGLITLSLAFLHVGCADTDVPGDEDVGTSEDALARPFTAEADDETIDPEDPPTDPDPDGEEIEVAAGGGVSVQDIDPLGADVSGSKGGCPKFSKLSPRGLTFAFDVVDQEQLKHLLEMKRYIRVRDIFVLRINGFPKEALQKHFPCNRTIALVWPDETARLGEMKKANPWIDGAAIDWEGNDRIGSVAQELDRLQVHTRRIRNHGMRPSLVPAQDRPEWLPMARRGNFAHLFAQTQPACKESAPNFGRSTRALAKDAHDQGFGARNVAMEISMNSYVGAQNHVDADRAAACTRKAYGKGSRAIYIFGQKRDQYVPYLRALAKAGVRRAK